VIARVAVALACVATVARADAPKLAAVAIDPADVRAAILIGPGGQVYGPAPDHGGWTRTRGGGIAAGVAAAAQSGGDVLAAGASTPIYTWRAGAWDATPLPRKGAVVLGAGPAPAAAIGTTIVVRGDKGWAIVGDAPAPPTAVWAASPTQVLVVANGAVWRLRGKAFVRGAAATRLAPGTRPLALAGAQVMDLSAGAGKPIRAGGEVIAATAAGADTWLLVQGASGLAVEHHAGARTTTTAAPATAAWAWIWADPHGRAALAAPDGALAVLDGGAWHESAAQDALPAPRAGAGPARSP
jgi:hypothetical protein